MPDILRDPLWQFVGALLGIFAIIVSIVLFFAQRKKKSLSYEILSKTPVLSAAEEIAGKLQILFQGEVVQKVYLLVIRISNTGNVPIASSDYERPISIRFGGEARILTTEVSESEPKNMDAKVETRDQNILVKPVLLNSGDSITIKSLVSNYSGKLNIDGRIIGVKNISPKRDTSNIWSVVLMIAGMVLFGIGAIGSRKDICTDLSVFEKEPFAAFSFFTGYILMISGMLMSRPYRRRLKRVLRKYLSG